MNSPEAQPSRGKFTEKIQGKLFFLLIILLIPSLFIQGYVYHHRFEHRRGEELQENLEMARVVARTFHGFVQDVLHQELTIGLAITSSQPMKPEDITRLLRQSDTDHAAIRDFSWVDPEGAFIYSSNPAMVGNNNRDRNYFKDIVGGREWTVGELVLARTTGQPVFGISRGIRSESGELLGVVVATVLPEQLGSLLSVERAKGGTINIIDNMGMLVYRFPIPHLKWEERNMANHLPAFMEAYAGKESTTTIISVFTGEKRLVGLAPIEAIGWIATAGRSEEAMVAEIRSSLLQQTILLILVSFAAFFAAMFFSRTIAGSIAKLREYAVALGRGDFGSTSITSGPAEIKDLAAAFTTMAERVKDREETLRKSEERLRTIGDNIPGGAIYQHLSDSQGRVTYVYMSAGIEKLLGMSAADVLAYPQKFRDLILEEDLPRLREAEEISARTLSPLDCAFRQRTVAGETRWIHCRSTPRPIGDGSILWDGVMVDVTKRKQLEEAVADSERRYRELVQNANSAIIRWRHDGTVIFFNEYAQSFFGYRAEEIMGKNVSLLVPGKDSSGVDLSTLIQDILRRPGKYKTTLNENICRDGRRVWMAWTNKAITDKDGQVSEILAVGTDITERKIAEAALQRQTALLQGINRVLREAICIESEEELAKTCLAIAEELTGSQFGFLGEIDENASFDSINLSAPGWDACRLPVNNERQLLRNMIVSGILGQVLLEGQIVTANEPSSHPDMTGLPEGHPPINAFMGVPLKRAERTFGMIALGNKAGGYDENDARDIEALALAFAEALLRKRAEEQIRKSHQELELRVRERTEEIERSNQALQDFVSIASHDLKEPLRKVISFGHILTQRHGEALGQSGKDYLGRITGAAERMQSLIHSLLEYSRVTVNPGDFLRVDLAEIIGEVLSDMEVRIESTGGEVLVEELPIIEANPIQMRQLFQNLIGNGLKFHKPGERPVVRVSSSVSGDFCRVSVEDNGIGFDEQYLQQIFAPFQRLHARNEYEGTGMGLAICQKISERHNGSITARSGPGKGSTFIIQLPLRQSVSNEQPRATAG